MKYNIPDQFFREIREIARENDIEKIFLFGSRARGTHSERSDIDLAVSGRNFLAFSAELEKDTHTLLMFDIVDLNKTISEDLQDEIKRDGVLIYEKT